MRRVNVRKTFIYIFFTIFYRIVIDWGYLNIVSVYFDYMGFYNYQTRGMYVLSYICLLFGMVFAHYCFTRFNELISTKIVAIMYLAVFVPFTSLIRFGIFPIGFIILNTVYWINLLLFNWLASFGRIKVSHIRIKGLGIKLEVLFLILTVLSWVVLIGISWRYAHFRLDFNLENVYDLRSAAKADSMPWLLRYAFGWARAALLVSIAYYSKKKKLLYAAISFLSLILSFGYDGAKGILFSSLLVVLINYAPGRNILKNNRMYILGIGAIVAMSDVLYAVTGNYSIASLVTRRVLFVPARLNWAYYDYFISRMPDYFRSSFLRHLGFTSPYPNMALLVGEDYGNGWNANNGLFGDAYANLGELGVFVFPVLLVIFFKILDKCTTGLDGLICLSLAIYISLELVDSMLFTSLLSHGLLVMALLLYFVRENDNNLSILDKHKEREIEYE